MHIDHAPLMSIGLYPLGGSQVSCEIVLLFPCCPSSLQAWLRQQFLFTLRIYVSQQINGSALTCHSEQGNCCTLPSAWVAKACYSLPRTGRASIFHR